MWYREYSKNVFLKVEKLSEFRIEKKNSSAEDNIRITPAPIEKMQFWEWQIVEMMGYVTAGYDLIIILNSISTKIGLIRNTRRSEILKGRRARI